MGIGERLKELRILNNFTLEEAGRKIGSTKQTLYKYENGIVTNIPSDKIEQLAEMYNSTPSYIMGWGDNHKQIKHEMPDELKELGVEYIMVAKKCKDAGLSPAQMEKLIETIKDITT